LYELKKRNWLVRNCCNLGGTTHRRILEIVDLLKYGRVTWRFRLGDLKNFTILVVDDEESLRQTIVFDFKRKGFNVLSAENGAQAFELVQTNKIHLVVSDIRMPGGDGVSLLEKIRQYDPSIPVVIFITGFADVTADECISKGAKEVLSKPFDRKALMNSVMQSLSLFS
jgi:CheY-like chemotaxis protein